MNENTLYKTKYLVLATGDDTLAPPWEWAGPEEIFTRSVFARGLFVQGDTEDNSQPKLVQINAAMAGPYIEAILEFFTEEGLVEQMVIADESAEVPFSAAVIVSLLGDEHQDTDRD